MKSESFERSLGYFKNNNIEDLIILRFIKNKSDRAFLSQINISKIYGCCQKTVSNKIRKMLLNKVISVYKPHFFSPKAKEKRLATEYILLENGKKLYNFLLGSVVFDDIEKENSKKELLFNKVLFLNSARNIIKNKTILNIVIEKINYISEQKFSDEKIIDISKKMVYIKDLEVLYNIRLVD
jgi:hypothetical protein